LISSAGPPGKRQPGKVFRKSRSSSAGKRLHRRRKNHLDTRKFRIAGHAQTRTFSAEFEVNSAGKRDSGISMPEILPEF